MLIKTFPILILSLILFYAIRKDITKGVSLLIFLIPFDLIDPLGSLWGVPAKFFTSTIFILVAYFSILKGKTIFENNNVLKDNSKIIILLFWGLVFGLLFLDKIKTVDQYSISALELSPMNQLIINFINGFVLLLFLQILYKGTNSLQNLLHHIEWFCYSIFFHILNPLSYFLNGKTITKIITKDTEELSQIRIGGLFFNFEFTTDYALIIIVFSLILILYNKKIPFLYITMAIALGIVSGSRSFLILLIILFCFAAAFIGKNYKKSRLPILFISIFIIGAFIYISQKYTSEIVILNHLQNSVELSGQNNFNQALNRPYEDIWGIVSQTPISGFGNFHHITSFHSYLTSHLLLLHIYLKFGIIGIFIFPWIYFRDIKALYRLEVNENLKYIKNLLIILLIILFLQNFKISFIRYSTTIYIYGFVYFIVRYFLQTTTEQAKSTVEQ